MNSATQTDERSSTGSKPKQVRNGGRRAGVWSFYNSAADGGGVAVGSAVCHSGIQGFDHGLAKLLKSKWLRNEGIKFFIKWHRMARNGTEWQIYRRFGRFRGLVTAVNL